MRWLAVLSLSVVLAGGCIDKPTEHRVRANAFLRAGDAQKALEECEAGLAEKREPSLLVLKGKALFELDRLDEARQSYLDAIAAAEKEPAESLSEAQLGLAMIATRKEDWKEAQRRFQALVELNPTDVDARLNLARVCLRMEELPCAIEHGEQAGRMRGNAEEVLFTLGRIYLVAKKYDEAKKTFEHICEVVPKAASCPYGVALVAAQQGDKPAALAKLREAIDLKLPNPGDLDKDALLAPLKGDPEFEKLAKGAR